MQERKETPELHANLTRDNLQVSNPLLEKPSNKPSLENFHSRKNESPHFSKTSRKKEAKESHYFTNSNIGTALLMESLKKQREVLEKTKKYAPAYKYDSNKPMYLAAKLPVSLQMNLKENQLSEFYLKQKNTDHLVPRSNSHGSLNSLQAFDQ